MLLHPYTPSHGSPERAWVEHSEGRRLFGEEVAWSLLFHRLGEVGTVILRPPAGKLLSHPIADKVSF
jgi:hypothetical protein